MNDTEKKIAPLLYWFPDADRIPPAWENRFGPATGIWGRLAGLLRGDGYLMRKSQHGPVEGKYGLMVSVGELAAPQDPESIRYEPSMQDWSEIEENVWCGLAKSAKPGDFLRKTITTPISYLLTSDRGDWAVPVAILDSDRCGLRMVDAYSRGAWARVPVPEHSEIAKLADRLYKAETGEGAIPDKTWMRDAAITALQINYALTGPELAMFGVLNDAAYDAVSAILTDREARQKKTAGAGG